MYLINSLAAIAALASTTLAAPAVETRQTALEPWQVTALVGFSPSGRPESYPWPTITANLTDPNELELGTSDADNSTVTVPAGNQAIKCQAKWLTGENPFGRSWPCDPSGDGYWTIKVVQTENFGVGNFTLAITRVAEKLYLGSRYRKAYEAQAHFEVGDNMSGSCGGSGVCSWGLKSELIPYPVQQHEVADE